jgi:3-oxoacyl-(acyl-carrier-protein) synthase
MVSRSAKALPSSCWKHSNTRKGGGRKFSAKLGYGAATDLHHLTQPQPQGNAAVASMLAACRSANVVPDQIDYVNAHGTGTVLNDSAEAEAINRWAGPQAKHLRVSSTKSSIGHLLGAAGAVEALVCLMALREQWIPPRRPRSFQFRSLSFSLFETNGWPLIRISNCSGSAA